MNNIDLNINKHFQCYSVPFVRMNYHTPNTDTYKFYASGDFMRLYARNAKTHKPRETDVMNADGIYQSFGEYMGEHHTKEAEEIKIPVFGYNNLGKNSKAKENSIIYDSVISICEDHTQHFGLGRDKEKIVEYFFNQFLRSHKYEKENWAMFGALHTNTDNDHLHVVFYQPKTIGDDKLVDYRNIKNLYTNKRVFERTKIYLDNVMEQSINQPLFKEMYESIHLLKAEFKEITRKKDNIKKLIQLSNDLNYLNQKKGRLQYANLEMRASLEQKYLKDKTPEQEKESRQYSAMKQKIDGVLDNLVYYNKDIYPKLDKVDALLSNALHINLSITDKELKKLPADKKDRYKLNLAQYREYKKELHRDLGNILLSSVKEINVENHKNMITNRIRRQKFFQNGKRIKYSREFTHNQKKYSTNIYQKLSQQLNNHIYNSLKKAQEIRLQAEKELLQFQEELKRVNQLTNEMHM